MEIFRFASDRDNCWIANNAALYEHQNSRAWAELKFIEGEQFPIHLHLASMNIYVGSTPAQSAGICEADQGTWSPSWELVASAIHSSVYSITYQRFDRVNRSLGLAWPADGRGGALTSPSTNEFLWALQHRSLCQRMGDSFDPF